MIDDDIVPAAAEMRQRVYKRLRQKSAETPERRREFSLLQSRLDGMRVCTMDAFCMSFVSNVMVV